MYKSQKTPSYIRKWTKVRSRFLCLSGCFGAITTGSSGCRITISSLVDEHHLSTTEKKMGKVVEWWCRQRAPEAEWRDNRAEKKKQVKIRISAFQVNLTWKGNNPFLVCVVISGQIAAAAYTIQCECNQKNKYFASCPSISQLRIRTASHVYSSGI